MARPKQTGSVVKSRPVGRPVKSRPVGRPVGKRKSVKKVKAKAKAKGTAGVVVAILKRPAVSVLSKRAAKVKEGGKRKPVKKRVSAKARAKAAAYKLVAYPNIGLSLKLGSLYTLLDLEEKCADGKQRSALHAKLANPKVFQPEKANPTAAVPTPQKPSFEHIKKRTTSELPPGFPSRIQATYKVIACPTLSLDVKRGHAYALKDLVGKCADALRIKLADPKIFQRTCANPSADGGPTGLNRRVSTKASLHAVSQGSPERAGPAHSAYKVIAYPKIGLDLKLGHVYALDVLEKKCSGNAQRRALYTKVADPKFFQLKTTASTTAAVATVLKRPSSDRTPKRATSEGSGSKKRK